VGWIGSRDLKDSGAPASKALARTRLRWSGKPSTSLASLSRADPRPDGRRESAAEASGE
jgi:hypothetical protein